MVKQLLVSHSLERWAASKACWFPRPATLPFFSVPPPCPSRVYWCSQKCSTLLQAQLFRSPGLERLCLLLIFPFQSSLLRWMWLSLILYTRKLREMKDVLKGTTETWVDQDSTPITWSIPDGTIPEFLSQLSFDSHKYHMTVNTLWNSEWVQHSLIQSKAGGQDTLSSD